jgi:glycosyltransferase involved in cell wall biosynthesis
MTRVLLVHVKYLQAGGEDVAFAEETEMLREHGHEVREIVLSNEPLLQMTPARAAATTVWSEAGRRTIREAVASFRPDIVHFHNTFPLLSPAVYAAARQTGAAVVQTLHNFRLVCPGGLLMRNGAPCEDCLGTHPWRSVVHKCYRESATASAAVSTMLTLHRTRGTWQHDVDAYICLTEFARAKLAAGGLPVSKLYVKGNSIRGRERAGARERRHFLYAGRLSVEKGVAFLARAWRDTKQNARLVVAGSGPDEAALRALNAPAIELVGQRTREEISDLLDESIAVIVPSLCYESFPLIVLEAFSRGVPVIASALGALPDIVEGGRTGGLFEAGNAQSLANAVQRMTDAATWQMMSDNAAQAFATRFSAERNYVLLMDIYDAALRARKAVA